MNLNDFQLLKEADDHYEIAHPRGAKLKINKKGMSAKAHEAIKKMCSGGVAEYFSGGGVSPYGAPSLSDSSSSSPLQANEHGNYSYDPSLNAQASSSFDQGMQNYQDSLRMDRGLPAIGDGAAPASSLLVASNQPTDGLPSPPQVSSSPEIAPQSSSSAGEVTPASIPGEVKPDAPAKTSSGMGGLYQEMAGERDLAKAKGAEGQNQAKAIDDGLDKVNALPSVQEIVDSYKPKQQELEAKFASQEVDPTHYIKSMSTGQRILSGIGLALSGFGSGLTGQPNLAAQALTNMIDKDVDAQKNSQQKTLSLFQMNKQALGNDLEANLQTKNQLLTAMKWQIQKQAALSQSPIEQANAKLLNGQIQSKIDQVNLQRAMFQPSMETSGGASAGTEQSYVNHLNMLKQGVAMGMVKPEVAKDIQERILPGIGVSTIAPTPEDRSELTNYSDIQKNLNEALAFQQDAQKGGGTGAWSPEKRHRAYIIQQNLVNRLDQLGDIKRMNDEQRATYKKMIGNPGSFDVFGSNASGFQQMQHEISTLQRGVENKLGVKRFAVAPADRIAMEWARKNPDDPSAQKILSLNGGGQ